jgi:hypothetical protein
MSPIRIMIRMLGGALMIAPLMWPDTAALAEEPDAKSIPKPMLMLGLFCNSALSAMKSSFETNPAAPPWLATGSKLETIKDLMSKLDATDAPYEKAIKDQAITAEEAKFIKFSALHESGQWLINISQSCAAQNLAPQAYETCLKETNSEVYKCYRHIIDGLQAKDKSSSIK